MHTESGGGESTEVAGRLVLVRVADTDPTLMGIESRRHPASTVTFMVGSLTWHPLFFMVGVHSVGGLNGRA